MRPFAISSILLLSSFPSAFSRAVPTSPPFDNQVPGCQYTDLTSDTYIYVTHPYVPAYVISIKTSCCVEDIIQRYEASGYIIQPEPSPLKKSDICGWHTLSKRGAEGIYVEISLHPPMSSPQTNKRSHFSRAPPVDSTFDLQIPGCQYRNLTSNHYIYYRLSHNPTDYSIRFSCKGKRCVQKVVDEKIVAVGGRVQRPPPLNESNMCGWKVVSTEDLNGIRVETSRHDYINRPPRTNKVFPRSLGDDHSRFKRNETASSEMSKSDATTVVLVTLVPILCLAIVYGMTTVLINHVCREEEKSDTDTKDIELSSINAPNTPERSTADLELPPHIKSKDFRRWDTETKDDTAATMFHTIRA